MKYVLQSLARACSFNTRSLSIYRIATGVAALYALLEIWWFRQPLLNPNGIMPISVIPDSTPLLWLYYIVPEYWFQITVFYATAVVAVLLILGVQSRFFALIAFILFTALEARILYAADTVGIRMALLWCIFLPVGLHYRLFGIQVKAKIICSIGTIGFCVQLLLLYVTAVYYKVAIGTWFTDPDLLYKILWWGGYTTPFGEWLRTFPLLLKALGPLAIAIELIGAVLLFVPWRQHITRTTGMCLLLLLHVGIRFSMNLSIFTYANVAILLAFIVFESWPKRQITYSFFSVREGIAGILTLLLLVQHAWYMQLLPKPPEAALKPLQILRLTDKWDMFAGYSQTKYYKFWPIAWAQTATKQEIDVWKWFIGQQDVSIDWQEPVSIAKLTPNNTIDKYVNNLTLYRGNTIALREPLLRWLCTEYNADHSNNPISQIALYWQWSQIEDIATFSTPVAEQIALYNCI